MIYLLRERATKHEIDDMLQIFGNYIKLAVDIERQILAGGGELHSECEAVLLQDGSRQKDVWGADWIPMIQEVAYESIINIRPSQKNRSTIILDPVIRERVAQIVQQLLGGI